MSQPLPDGPDAITPGWLTGALRAAGALGRGSVRDLAWEIIGEEWGFTGVLARVRVDYDGPGAEERSPRSLVAKFPTATRGAASAYLETALRRPAGAQRHFERSAREVAFYTDIAPRSGVPVPRLYYGAADEATGRVVLLLEDCIAARPGDMLRGCTVDEAAQVIAAIAPLHARWWARPALDELRWLPGWGEGPQQRQARLRQQVGPFLERFGGALPPAVRGLVERLGAGDGRVFADLAAAPATVIHGDLHLDNILFSPAGHPSPVVILDWQGVSRRAAVVDLGFFLFGSLEVEDRRRSGDDLVRQYHASLVEHGVRGYSLGRLTDDLRRALLWQLAGTVTWLGAADGQQRSGRERALMDAALGDGRLIAALLDYVAAR